MIGKEELKNFLEQYGSLVEEYNGRETSYGILAPVRDLSVKFPQVTYAKAGFIPKKEYALITLPDSDFIQKNCIVKIEGKLLKIVDTEEYCLTGKKLYRKSYAYELRELVET